MNRRLRNKRMFPKVSNFRKCLLKVNDEVKIIAGNDKGRVGRIVDFDRKRGKIKVEGVRMQTHYIKRTETEAGGMIKKEGFFDVSNVMFLEEGECTRLKRNEAGKRISVKTKNEV